MPTLGNPSDNPREEPPGDLCGPALPLVPKDLAHLRIFCASPAHANAKGPYPPQGRKTCCEEASFESRAPRSVDDPRTHREGAAFGQPRASGEVGHDETCNDEERAGVGRMANIGIKAGGDEGM